MTECTQPSTPSAPCPTGSSNPAAAPSVSRRGFLSGAAVAAGAAALAGLAGCAPKTQAEVAGETIAADDAATGGAMQTTDPAKAVWPVVEEVEVGSAGEGVVAFVAEPIPADKIVATHDVDVVVCGLGPAGDAAALACAEQGLKTVAVEKQNRGNYNSATIGGTNSELHKFWGMEYDTTEWMSDAMIGCSFQADMTLYQHYLEKNGEAVNWYISHFDNQDFNDYPLTFAAGDFPDFREQYDPTALSRSWNTSLNLPYPPGELADILAGILTEAGVEIRYETPACQLVTDEAGSVTGVIVKSADGYEQYNCAKGVVLATGGYEFNQQMLKERCRPRGVPGRWLTGAFGNTGDGLQMGVAVGAAEDEFPQSIMLDPEQLMPFVRVNKLGKRFTPEYDPYGQLAMAIQYQPGTYDFYIVDSALDTKIDKIWTPSSSWLRKRLQGRYPGRAGRAHGSARRRLRGDHQPLERDVRRRRRYRLRHARHHDDDHRPAALLRHQGVRRRPVHHRRPHRRHRVPRAHQGSPAHPGPVRGGHHIRRHVLQHLPAQLELPLAHAQLPDGLHYRPGARRQGVAPHPHLFR